MDTTSKKEALLWTCRAALDLCFCTWVAIGPFSPSGTFSL